MLDLRTLGALDLVRPDGTRVQSIMLQPKRAALLIYLRLARPGQYHRRDALLPLFWPESDESSARHSLSQALYKLRQSLGEDAIQVRGDEEIRLAETVVSCDAATLWDALKRGRWEDVLDSYSGDFLAGFHVSADGFERWLDEERLRLRDAVASAAWSLADAQMDRGAVTEAVRTATRALKLDPTSEGAARVFMSRLADRGARAEAVAFYEKLRSALAETLELEPSADTQQAATELRRLSDSSPEALNNTRRATVVAWGRGANQESQTAHWLRILKWVVPTAAVTLPLLYARDIMPRTSRGDRHIESLVVLPLENLGNDPAREYFADGMHEALISELARIKSVRVTSRTSALHYRGSSKSLDEIARELGVDGAIEGSVLHTGDSVRIDLQLFATRPERHLWSASYQRSLSNVLSLHRDLAHAIANEISATLTSADSARLAQRASVNAAAYDAWLKGSYAQSRRSAASDADCIRYGKQSASLDSTYGAAYQLLAECYSIQTAVASAPPLESFGRTKAAARRALELDRRSRSRTWRTPEHSQCSIGTGAPPNASINALSR